jgi:glutathione S-transferase
VIEDGDVTLADSNAILVYLAGRYDKSGAWYPRDALAAARVQQWLSVAAGQLAAGPATARVIKVFGAPLDHARAVAISTQLLPVLDQALASQAFLTGAAPTIADVAIYSYTAHAPEGEVSLDRTATSGVDCVEALRVRADAANAGGRVDRDECIGVARRRGGAPGARRHARAARADRPARDPQPHAGRASRAVRELPMLVVGSLDAGGRPGVLLVGRPGFIASPDARTPR